MEYFAASNKSTETQKIWNAIQDKIEGISVKGECL